MTDEYSKFREKIKFTMHVESEVLSYQIEQMGVSILEILDEHMPFFRSHVRSVAMIKGIRESFGELQSLCESNPPLNFLTEKDYYRLMGEMGSLDNCDYDEINNNITKIRTGIFCLVFQHFIGSVLLYNETGLFDFNFVC